MTFDLFSCIDTRTITGGLFGAGLVWFGEIVRAKYKKSKNAHYLAVRFIPILEQFLDSSYAVAFDDGTSQGMPAGGDGTYESQRKEPILKLPTDVDWKSIDKKLLERIMQISSDLYLVNKTLEGEAEFADPPYSEFMSIRQYQYAKFSIKCDDVLKDIRTITSIPSKEYPEWWNPREKCLEKISRFEEIQKKKEEANAKTWDKI